MTEELELTKHFVRGLAKHGLSLEDMKDYKYCGGDSKQHLNYWNLFNRNKNLDTPDYTTKCICGHDIEDNCYIIHKTSENILVLGNCCIQKFCPDSGRTCDDCGEPHRNRKVNRCNECRKGKCDECDKKCNPDFPTCYACKFGETKKTNCDSCGKELSSKTEICECKKKVVMKNGVKINACSECGKQIDGKYSKCFECNNKNKSGECKVCGKKCDIKYQTCFNCKK